MATTQMRLESTQTWIYPALNYLGYDNVRKKKNHWYKGHSQTSKRDKYCYQGGTANSDGKYNGNMLSFIFFDHNGQTQRQFFSGIGTDKISRITLRLTGYHAYNSSFNAKICLTPFWWSSSNWGSGGIHECPHDSYSAMGILHLRTVTIARNGVVDIDLTPYKHHFNNYESLCIYAPGAYNKDNSAYGAVYGHKDSGSKAPRLTVEYSTNSAPHAPTIRVNNQKDAHGYITPALNFSVLSNGDPDNNIHSNYPYSYDLRNQNGDRFHDHGWESNNTFYHGLHELRGQTVKITGWIRDNNDLRAVSSTNVYINSLPKWNNKYDEQLVKYDSGVENSVFKNNIAISWPRASDRESAHNSNLVYSVYYQKGDDRGPAGDQDGNKLRHKITTNHTTITADELKNKVGAGERIYFSVWAYDTLECSEHRIVSSWIYKDSPPGKPSNIAPTGGHYESGIKVTWAKSSSSDGTHIDHYVISMQKENGEEVRRYTSKEPVLNCNDVGLIPRGQKFKFKIYSVNNFGTNSEPGYSNLLIRNSAPTKPGAFRPNSNAITFKNNIPLIWNPSSDVDGDAIKYNIYYSVNGGGYQTLSTGISGVSYNHDISRFNPGTKFNYYLEAYDTFNIFSEKIFISTQVSVNVPPEKPSILLPIQNRVLYTREPRIIFKTGNVFNDNRVKFIVNINNVRYDSSVNTTLFNKSSYGKYEEGMFMVPSSAPLNYSKENIIQIKVLDSMDESEVSKYIIGVDASLENEIGAQDHVLIDDGMINSIKRMINKNRFAYNLKEISWTNIEENKSLVSKTIFDQFINASFELNEHLNSKAKNDILKRNYQKPATNLFVQKSIINTIITTVKKP